MLWQSDKNNQFFINYVCMSKLEYINDISW
jgi:hypothetical protein